jgi:phosphoglycolate phosphatase
MIRNIIFDWSGTLVDDLPAVWQATNHVFKKAGRPEITLDQFRAEFCLPFDQFYRRFVSHVAMPQLEEWFHGRFREVQQTVAALPHAREFLTFCRAGGVRTFVLSTVHRDHFAEQARRLDLLQFLDRPYVEILDKRRKIHELLAENSLSAAETLFIGDMQHDIETAHHGGVHSCAVLTGFNRLDQLRASRPERIVEHLGELREVLERDGMAWRPQGQGTIAELRPIPTVGALIFNGARVLMIRTHKWSDKWGIPGGKIKAGEASVDALRRELKEETDLDIQDIEFVLVQDCIHSAEFYRDAHFLLLNYTCRCVGEPRVSLNEEAQQFEWVTLEQAQAMDVNEPTRILLAAVRKRAPGS